MYTNRSLKNIIILSYSCVFFEVTRYLLFKMYYCQQRGAKERVFENSESINSLINEMVFFKTDQLIHLFIN